MISFGFGKPVVFQRNVNENSSRVKEWYIDRISAQLQQYKQFQYQ